ncbi:MAG TPA: RNA repair transcriptional activator RtcR family protein [Candidatus Hydrogenedentes bacterium]|nr:RNA repair transcriptional activator RtcR family protein [Candidatus Hydrogenedentota bacterium]HOV73297.1 RNA repair transcriptional activator RtcR family protein [Candidatus Hydrogenedentota bacterium]HPC15470.1 RNA repair transcriptional activator RtcR family protein [Candidatus Hydrogenedentota bacterium]HRT20253.1 RNA repair transcriptional activator RtcR family protein [Candidatus Hydrogenedentota bacterium]HRT64316.1 RNA repair transcriptional activator RtcR family protein [Candidatus
MARYVNTASPGHGTSKQRSSSKQRMLLTFVGSHDPSSPATTVDGPIVSLVRELTFETVILFTTPPMEPNAESTKIRLMEVAPQTQVEIEKLNLNDPTDHVAVLSVLRRSLKRLHHLIEAASVSVSVTSGTPQIHACWFLLAASGELPCTVLQIRPRQYVTMDRPIVSAIDLTRPEFPRVIPAVCKTDWARVAPTNTTALLDRIGIIGEAPAFVKAIEDAIRFANSPLSILILGESGTGKELFARLIHEASGRTGKLEAVNCAGIPDQLLESELFGHVKGAFTGAEKDRKGLIDMANKGTLFLDEIGEMPMNLQAKLLRVLQDREVRPVGSEHGHLVDVRIVAATNADLERGIREKSFRKDLYFRLSGMQIRLPALRERRGDVARLAQYFLSKNNASKPIHLTREAITALEAYTWPGNIRELKDTIDRALTYAQGRPAIDAEDIRVFPLSCEGGIPEALPEPHEGFDLKEYKREIDRKLKRRALELAEGNEAKAARLLGISPQAMNKHVREKTHKSQ